MIVLNDLTQFKALTVGLPPRCFIKNSKALQILQKVSSEFVVSEDLPTKEHPGIYTFVNAVDKTNNILSFRHSDQNIYGLRSIGAGKWCPRVAKGIPIEQSLERHAMQVFFEIFSAKSGIELALAGMYINKLTPEDATKIGVIYECTIENLSEVAFEGNLFFENTIMKKEEAFKQSTKYDHWSSQVIFSMCNPSLLR